MLARPQGSAQGKIGYLGKVRSTVSQRKMKQGGEEQRRQLHVKKPTVCGTPSQAERMDCTRQSSFPIRPKAWCRTIASGLLDGE